MARETAGPPDGQGTGPVAIDAASGTWRRAAGGSLRTRGTGCGETGATEPIRELLFGDAAIARVRHLFGLGHPLPFRIFSLPGDTWGILLAVGVARRLFGRRSTESVVGIVAAGALTKVALSWIFFQSRPQGPEIVIYGRLEVSSFPSGHVDQALGPRGLPYVLGCVPYGGWGRVPF